MNEPCRHLNFEDKYGGQSILKDDGHGVRYWHRVVMADRSLPCDVQYCNLVGRINSIYDCYGPGFKSCYEPDTDKEVTSG